MRKYASFRMERKHLSECNSDGSEMRFVTSLISVGAPTLWEHPTNIGTAGN